ncbi:hypothetical protein ACFQ80_10915 [Isoptericola sp. NPDC056578]|uniref:hypothetical protein n=1 Tax=Isoptericola sp. NPDC056578 TaxID=3345870 RepID=UPI00368C1D63
MTTFATVDLARDDVRLDDLIGRRAVFTTYEGDRLVGAVERARDGLHIVFDDGRHGHVGVAATLDVEI